MSSLTSPSPTHAPERSDSATGSNRGRGIGTAVLGGVLVALGLRRRSLGGMAAAVAGSLLLARAVGQRRSRTGKRDSTTGIDRREAESPTRGTDVTRTITVEQPAEELYDHWRDPDTLSQIVGEFAEVTARGDDRLHWTVEGPLGWNLTWDAQIVEDRPGEALRWESLEGTGVPNGGSVRFRPAPGDRGTEVTLHLEFDPPGGPLGDAAARLVGIVPETLAYKALYRARALAETGEIPTLERNPSGRGLGDLL